MFRYTLFLLISMFFHFAVAHQAEAQEVYILRAASGDLTAGETVSAVDTKFLTTTIVLDVTKITTPDADDEVDFYFQTTYDGGTTWTDLQNFHFDTDDDGNTATKVAVITTDIDGPGDMRIVDGANPSAGAEISQAVPSNTIWRLWGAYATMVTDAGVANRRVSVLINDGTNTVFSAEAGAVQIASTTETYTIGPHATVSAGHWIPTPTGMLMLAGWTVLTSTSAIEAGDNWGIPRFTVEAWGDPNNSTDGTLGDNLKVYRPMGSQIRIKVTITGATAPTYAYTARGVFR